MQKRAVITIAGSIGSGKSTTSRALAKALGFEHFSAGDWQKNKAESLGLPLSEYHKMIEENPAYDREADNALIAAGEKGNIVIDSRLGFHFIPDSFKVFLVLDPLVAAKRMLEDAEKNPMRHKEVSGGLNSVEQILESIGIRVKSEAKRYFAYYGVKDHMSPTHFDICVNTGSNRTDTIIPILSEAYTIWHSQ